MTLLSQEYLLSRINYNPESGEARWKLVDQSYGIGWTQFNNQYAGKLLGNRPSFKGKRYTLPKIIQILGAGENCSLVDQSIIKELPKFTSLNYLAIDSATTSLVRLDHRLGLLFWLPRGNPRFDNRYAGKEAGKYGDEYAKITIKGVDYAMHRVIWAKYYNIDPGPYLIDHIDRNKYNNSVTNLRLSTFTHNSQNNNAKGWSKSGDKYRARLHTNYKTIHLGNYDTEALAVAAYKSALQKYKPIYKFTTQEQAMLDELYATYPNADPKLQLVCHDLQVHALKFYVDAAIVQS